MVWPYVFENHLLANALMYQMVNNVKVFVGFEKTKIVNFAQKPTVHSTVFFLQECLWPV